MNGKAGRSTMMVGAVVFLSACGQQKSTSTTFEKASGACQSEVIPQKFMVRFEDGTRRVVKASSEEEFIATYLEPNLEKIRYAEPDYKVHRQDRDILPRKFARHGLVADNWGVQKIDADLLWAQNIRGAGVSVAIVDTGMDVTHPQLINQVLANAGEMGLDLAGNDRAHNQIDDDGNGLIDDSGGWDFVGNQPLTADNSIHGTHVGGIIAAAHSDLNAQSTNHVQGVAPMAKLLPLAFLDAQGSGSMSDGVKAIEYAAHRGVRVINASWGGSQCSTSLREEIASLEARGIVFVVAAGNDSANIDAYPEYPAALNLAAQITVGATGESDYKAEYSNYGLQNVHLFAPGSDITSTLPGDRMGSLSGTSMATPFVTGAVALLLSAVPSATVAQIRQALFGTVVRRGDYLNATRGRMSLRNALAALRALL